MTTNSFIEQPIEITLTGEELATIIASLQISKHTNALNVQVRIAQEVFKAGLKARNLPPATKEDLDKIATQARAIYDLLKSKLRFDYAI